jgi:hypothetical protein
LQIMANLADKETELSNAFVSEGNGKFTWDIELRQSIR